jgi:hypothetical protein
MKLFPVGTVSAASKAGSINSISYYMFEPNNGCHSTVKNTILTTLFQDQTLLTRKKADPTLTLSYEYDNIFDREYRQIEFFVNDVEDALDPFFIVDFSKGQSPSAVASSAGVWTVHLDNTVLYSKVLNQKANKVFLWDGHGNWKVGDVLSLTANASVRVDIGSNNFGSGLTNVTASKDSIIYPIYEVYFMQNAMASFKTTVYLDGKMTSTEDSGYMRSGTLSFISKYKV